MRVLVTTPPGVGHVHPMVPLARALQARGHEVRWATAAEACSRVGGAGLRAVEAGRPVRAVMAEAYERHPEARDLAPDALPDFMFSRIFGGVAAPAMLADLVPLVQEWEPDLVVNDAAELAGPIVAAMVGAPSVTKAFGPTLPEVRVAAAGEVVAPLWRSVGLEPPPYAGCYEHLYLDVYPPGLQPPLPDHIPRHQALRPVAYDVAEVDAGPLPLPAGNPDSPLVYLTMGTVFNNPGGLGEAVDALAALDVRLLVTVGPDGDPASLGDQPPHVRVERYVPQTLVLGHCNVVASHAGSGTVLATLALGIPQLCLPQGADQFANAAAVARAGAGLALAPGAATGEAIAQAVARLLDERPFRVAATDIGATIASMPGPDQVAAILEELADGP